MFQSVVEFCRFEQSVDGSTKKDDPYVHNCCTDTLLCKPLCAIEKLWNGSSCETVPNPNWVSARTPTNYFLGTDSSSTYTQTINGCWAFCNTDMG